ncbi:hypothetical protein [Caballeronia sp. DA-9]|uniref:hypothetical protein n=1 Tax=Caballeronia sp. DA-9 TaxID=3436237 RepID=UPI003F680929
MFWKTTHDDCALKPSDCALKPSDFGNAHLKSVLPEQYDAFVRMRAEGVPSNEAFDQAYADVLRFTPYEAAWGGRHLDEQCRDGDVRKAVASMSWIHVRQVAVEAMIECATELAQSRKPSINREAKSLLADLTDQHVKH